MKKRLFSLLAAGVFLLSSAGALMSVHAEGSWSPIRGYSNAQGSISEAGGVTTLTGYGGAKYSERIPVVEGTAISMTVSPEKLLGPGYNNLFAIALLNVEGSFFGGGTDTGSGFAVSAKSFGDYTGGFNLWYNKAAGKQVGPDVRIANKNIQKDMSATDLYITLTKKAQTVENIAYTWEIRITNSQTDDEMVHLVPAADVPENTFAGGAYLVAGHRQTATKPGIETVQVDIRDLTIIQPETITVKTQVADRAVFLGDEMTLTMANVFDVPEGKTAVYTASHGTIADGVWSYTPAALGTEEITISAGFDAGEILASVKFKLTAKDATWRPIRGYGGNLGSIDTNNGVTAFDGYGGARYTKRIPVEEGTAISMTVSAKELVLSHNNVFSVALLDTEGSFFGGGADTGCGFAVSAKSFGDYKNGFNMWYNKASGKTVGTDVQIKPNIAKDMTATDLHITLTKKTQTVEDIAYTWEIRITNSQTDDEMVHLVPASDVPADLFADGVYLVAGCRSNKSIRVELSDLTVTHPETITVKTEAGDRSLYLGDALTLNMSDLFGVPAGKTAVYTVSHGTVTDGVWSYTPAALGTEEITISAGFEAGSPLASVTFKLTAKDATWRPLRGYGGDLGSLETIDGVTALIGYGGAKYAERIPVEEGTAITLTMSPKVMMPTYANLFSVALLNTEGSFFGGSADTASGFAVSARSFGNYTSGFNTWYQKITDGQPAALDLTPAATNRIEKADGKPGNVNHNMIETDLQITFIKRAQTIDGVDYSWEIRLTAVQTGDKLVHLVPAADVPNDMFADGAYLTAGYRIDKEIADLNTVRVDLSGLKITQPDDAGITLIGKPDDMQAQKNESLTLDLAEIFLVSGNGTVTYTASAGEIKAGVWHYTFAGGEPVEVTITAAIDGTEISETVRFTVEEAALWEPLRGYAGALGSVTMKDGTDVELNGYGAARLSTPITIKEGTKISFTLTLPQLNKVDNNPFAVGLVNDPNSFLGGDADTGSGIAFMVKSFSDYENGYNLWYGGVKDGRADNFLRMEERNTESDLTKAKLVVTMEKKTQTVGGVKYGWVITVTDAASDEAYTQLVPADEVPDEVFAGKPAYLVAGCRSGKPIKAELSDIIVTEAEKENKPTGVAVGGAAVFALCAALPCVFAFGRKSRKKGDDR